MSELISEVTYYHIFHTLFMRGKSLGPAHTWREVITQGHKYQEARIINAILEAAYSDLGANILPLHTSVTPYLKLALSSYIQRLL